MVIKKVKILEKSINAEEGASKNINKNNDIQIGSRNHKKSKPKSKRNCGCG